MSETFCTGLETLRWDAVTTMIFYDLFGSVLHQRLLSYTLLLSKFIQILSANKSNKKSSASAPTKDSFHQYAIAREFSFGELFGLDLPCRDTQNGWKLVVGCLTLVMISEATFLLDYNYSWLINKFQELVVLSGFVLKVTTSLQPSQFIE